jgi:uncharacterized protein YbaP (TraB family)
MRLVTALSACLACAVTIGTPHAQTNASSARHFLWTVRSAAGSTPTYLLGSLHVLTPDFYPLAAPIEEAFKRSKVLIEEVDMDELTNPSTLMPLLAKAVYMDGRSLESAISPELYKSVLARADKAGVPAVALQRMKPWMAAVSLTAPALKTAGFNAELGIDRHFFDRAKAAGLERRALETVAYQFDRFDEMPAALQEAMLRSVLDDLDTQFANVKSIAAAWQRGDVMALEKDLLAAFLETPALYERLLAERNRNWVASVEACVKQGEACFVVVGAAHLVGPQSLVSLLRDKGFVVDQQ